MEVLWVKTKVKNEKITALAGAKFFQSESRIKRTREVAQLSLAEQKASQVSSARKSATSQSPIHIGDIVNTVNPTTVNRCLALAGPNHNYKLAIN
jgi:hypothetical protein